MCQPGRPSPQGLGQEVSSPSLRAFQSAKSSGRLLELGGARLLALVHRVGVAVREPPVGVEAADPEVDVAARLVGVAGIDQGLDQGDDRPDRLGRPRLVVGAAEPEGVGVGDVAAIISSACCAEGTPRSAAAV